ncbi:hypothetical protein NPIL_82341 [Nephila pilipes]|uniref:Uncharacterized protein n=1 Tax=Nephila pilipes TaxID=299642 RepID=A0A8X6QVF7_NEPPI|nr:hypothetical protein NPIL_82341 [Nephila pilipes]
MLSFGGEAACTYRCGVHQQAQTKPGARDSAILFQCRFEDAVLNSLFARDPADSMIQFIGGPISPAFFPWDSDYQLTEFRIVHRYLVSQVDSNKVCEDIKL